MKKSLIKKLSIWRDKYMRVIQIDKTHAKQHNLDEHDIYEQKVDESLSDMKKNNKSTDA